MMDWQALTLSLQLAGWTMLILFPLGIWLGRLLAWRVFPGRALIEALLALPLVLPPTVLGYYLLVAMGSSSPLGRWFEQLSGHSLVFSFSGLLLASVLFNLPFAIQPMQRAFEAIAPEVRAAAACTLGWAIRQASISPRCTRTPATLTWWSSRPSSCSSPTGQCTAEGGIG